VAADSGIPPGCFSYVAGPERLHSSFGLDNVTTFQQLNQGWNAEPNAPEPRVQVAGRDVLVTFLMNPFKFGQFGPEDIGRLRFVSCQRYRLGATNDEGWYRGQCRFSKLAPSWGEFYEVGGDLRLSECPNDWVELAPARPDSRHFLFYFRDQTFECDAVEWSFEVLNAELGAAPNCGPASLVASSGVMKGPQSVT
jgi:hypothetical protein